MVRTFPNWVEGSQRELIRRFCRATLAVLGFLGTISCASAVIGEVSTQNQTDPRRTIVISSRTLMETGGGRLDWCHDSNLIAFDRMTSRTTSEVFTIRPDGSEEHCLTCDIPGLPPGIRGQPAWHPSCEYLVIQVAGQHYKGSRFEFVSWGIHNDLWLIAADGSWAEPLVKVGYLGASLHPHFSDSGDRLFWTVRESTGKRIPQRLLLRTPGEENPWDGWHLAIAKFERPSSGGAKLYDKVDLYRGEGGFFESHALRGDTIWFSHTKGGQPYVDDVFRARADGTHRVNLINSPGTWEEHAEPSPGGLLVTFNSSRGFPWHYPPDTALTLRLELWARSSSGELFQLTHFNERVGKRTRVLTSDYAWGPSGREIALYYATFRGLSVRQGIEILELDRSY